MFLAKLGRTAARHRWIVVAAWLVGAIGLAALSHNYPGSSEDEFAIPGADSQKAVDLLEERFPAANGPTATVVFHATSGTVEDDPAKEGIETTVANLGQIDEVGAATDPFGPLGAVDISEDKTIAYSTVTFEEQIPELPEDTLDKMMEAATPAVSAGLDVEYGGAVTDFFSRKEGGISEYSEEIGLGLAVIVLLLAFGSFIAMFLPIGVAIFGIAISSILVTLLENGVAIPTLAPILGTMIGLGVGIDYSLFIVTRYRQNLADGRDVEDAVANAIGTAGAAVVFAGITVCIATAGLAIVGIGFITTLGLVAALFVAVMVIAAVTLLPALLGIAGKSIDRWRVPGIKPTTSSSVADEEGRYHGWARWAHEVARRPVTFAIVSLAVLLVLAAPVLRLQLGWTDDGDEPTDLTQRRAYDLLSEGFGPGVNGPLLVAAAVPSGESTDDEAVQTAMGDLTTAIGDTEGVASVSPAIPSPDKDAFIAIVEPTTAPNSTETEDLLHRLRDDTIPEAVEGTDIPAADVHIGGATAQVVDLTTRVTERLMWFIGAVVAGSFVLLMMVFRSVLVPLKAAIMNLLSIGAAYGVVVAMFQFGWAKDLIGLQDTVPVVAFVPLMMFAILFGLSMDYEVFLLSRIQEDYRRTGDNAESVITGLTSTARVITSAALVMIVVFLSFVTDAEPVVKMMGVGLSVAVFVDATIVRMVLVPATMELLGDANWWLPRWLDRILPSINVEGTEAEPEPEAAATS